MAALLLISGCTGAETPTAGDAAPPNDLAFDDGGQATTTSTTVAPTTTTTQPPPVPLGSPDRPFAPLPPSPDARAVLTPTGVLLPVLGRREERFTVMTACENVRYVPGSKVEEVGRAHIVLDPGHGGTEVGAVGPQGTTEKDLNLAVALEAMAALEARGATVAMTRTADHNVTTAARGLLAKSIDPALFVSIHHNGGSPRSGNRPGTIVFTKSGSETSTRFGGLFHARLAAVLEPMAEQKRAEHGEYIALLEAHEAAVAAYDQSVVARDQALVANGQLPASATTVPAPAPTPADGFRYPSHRAPVTTTTPPPAPPTNPDGSPATNPDGSVIPPPTTVAVPDTIAVPPSFAPEPVREFLFAGGPNAGVRSWVRPDGRDYLSVLRNSGEVPAVLAEFLYVTNPSEEELLMEPEFISAEARALVEAIVDYFSSTENHGDGFVDDQFDDQPIGGGGRPSQCVEPDYGLD